MPKIWPYDMIRELLALADAKGESIATLDSEREAVLFRYAIYSFRRINPGVGDNLSVTLSGTSVIVTKRLSPVVHILQEQET